MTKKRRTALESFAQRNGITRDQPEGQFLFEPARDEREKSDGTAAKIGFIDKAEGFFRFAAELMTPTPAKKKVSRLRYTECFVVLRLQHFSNVINT